MNDNLKEALEPIERLSITLKNVTEKYLPKIDFSETISKIVPTIPNNAIINEELLVFINEICDSLLEQVTERITILADISKPSRAILALAEAQYVRWDYYPKEFIEEIIYSDDINETLRLHHEKDDYKSVFETLERCKNSSLITNDMLLEESIATFKNAKFNTAILGFSALIDNALTISSHNTNTSIGKRAKCILDELVNRDDELDNNEYALMSLLYTFEKTIESFDRFEDFSKPEPICLNRHWLMHGRSTRIISKLDCVKVINLLYGIILLDELLQNDYTGE